MTNPGKSYSPEQIRSIVYIAAGIGTAAIMKLAPSVIMPTEELEEACELFLKAIAAGEEPQ